MISSPENEFDVVWSEYPSRHNFTVSFSCKYLTAMADFLFGGTFAVGGEKQVMGHVMTTSKPIRDCG